MNAAILLAVVAAFVTGINIGHMIQNRKLRTQTVQWEAKAHLWESTARRWEQHVAAREENADLIASNTAGHIVRKLENWGYGPEAFALPDSSDRDTSPDSPEPF